MSLESLSPKSLAKDADLSNLFQAISQTSDKFEIEVSERIKLVGKSEGEMLLKQFRTLQDLLNTGFYNEEDSALSKKSSFFSFFRLFKK